MITTTCPRVLPAYVRPERHLVCDTCQQWTPHALNASATAYVCGCGTEVRYIVNKAPAMEAIGL